MENLEGNVNINWSSSYNTGIERIDFEHRIFLELVNSLKKALDHSYTTTQLHRILIEIEKYAEFHFISEENFMMRIEYPDFKKHQILHFELLEQFNLAKYDKLGFENFYEFIKEWFINHTVAEDIKIRKFIVDENINIDDIHYNLNIQV
jgi:hemerythrin